MAELDVTGGTIQVGDLGLRTRNLVGSAELVDAPAGPGLRAAGGTSEALQAGLDRADMETVYVVDLQATAIDAADEASRAAGGQVEAIELDVPQPTEGFEQAVLSVDAQGVTTWTFAPPAERTEASRGGLGTRTFVVKRTSGPPPDPAEGANRSIFGEAGKQLLKVVAFPIGSLVGRAANSFIGDWEQKNQGYGDPRLPATGVPRGGDVLRRRRRSLAGACGGPDPAVRPRDVQSRHRCLQRDAR